MKGILTKVIFETNLSQDIERGREKEDEAYLENQVICDGGINENMEGVEQMTEFDFTDFIDFSDDEEEDEVEKI